MNFKILVLLVLVMGCSKSEVKQENKIKKLKATTYLNKKLQVYTTARNTNLRLTKTNELTFKEKIQPLETEHLT